MDLSGSKGLDSSPALMGQMQKNAISLVRRLERSGTLTPSGHDGHGVTWKVE
jgi:hypothetical protein